MKKYRYVIFVVTLFLIFLIGCESTGCLKVGGGFKDYKGNIEYCFNEKKSIESGVPVFQSENKFIYGFSETEIGIILEKLGTPIEIKSEISKEHQLRNILRRK